MPLDPFPATQSAIEAQWPGLGAPGDWWTGAERVAILREARSARACDLCARRKAALSPYAVDGAHPPSGPLAATTVDAVHRIATDPGRLSSTWFHACEQAGHEAAAVVEIGGVVGTLVLCDTLSRALGQPLRPLPEPQSGEPTRELPAGLVRDGGWAPMVDPDRAEGVMRGFFDALRDRVGFVYNVTRSLSASPSAWGSFFQTFLPNYATTGPMPEGALSRVQVELLAATTSAHNDCFY